VALELEQIRLQFLELKTISDDSIIGKPLKQSGQFRSFFRTIPVEKLPHGTGPIVEDDECNRSPSSSIDLLQAHARSLTLSYK